MISTGARRLKAIMISLPDCRQADPIDYPQDDIPDDEEEQNMNGAYKIQNRESLLAELAEKLHVLEKGRHNLNTFGVKVSFLQGTTVLLECYGLSNALDYLVNDVYYSDEGNWSEADHLEVSTY